jgi:hypothetical protein
MLFTNRNNNKCLGNDRHEPEVTMQNTLSPPPQDFDEWSALALSDPQAFEDFRERIIDEAILRAPAHKQPRLRRMQWKLNQIRKTSRTPMIACLRMNRMLWESVVGDKGLLNCLFQPDNSRLRSAAADKPSAVILPFKQPR